MITQNWIIQYFKMYKIYENIIDFLRKATVNKKRELVLYSDLRPGQTCHSKVMHRKEVTHSDGSYGKKSRRRARLKIWDKVKSHATIID